jgi:hypothetical protein
MPVEIRVKRFMVSRSDCPDKKELTVCSDATVSTAFCPKSVGPDLSADSGLNPGYGERNSFRGCTPREPPASSQERPSYFANERYIHRASYE